MYCICCNCLVIVYCILYVCRGDGIVLMGELFSEEESSSHSSAVRLVKIEPEELLRIRAEEEEGSALKWDFEAE